MQPPLDLDENIVTFVEHVATAFIAHGPTPTPVLDAVVTNLDTVVAAVTTAIVTASPTMSPPNPISSSTAPGQSQGDCELVGPFALIVQGALGALALLSLVFKRWRERPQRPVKIWFFDASKQVFGSVLVHMANIFMSMLTSGRFHINPDPSTATTAQNVVTRMLLRRDEDGASTYVPNPCSSYLLNLGIDVSDRNYCHIVLHPGLPND